jgi:hypothetical protein
VLALALVAATLSLHAAKAETFDTLLTITEQTPDAIDATHATVSVGRCSRISGGWSCAGSLAPVLESGIPTVECYRVRARLHRRPRVSDVTCPPQTAASLSHGTAPAL